jgi:hypothetical protein
VGDPLQDSFQKGFQDFLSSTKQLDGILAKAHQAETNPQTREALSQFLEMFRGVQVDLEKDLPGGVEEMVQDLRQGQKDMAAHMAKAGDLITKLEEIEQRANNTIEEGKARLAEAERLPQPPTAADLARQRLGKMAIRHGATGDLSNRPILKEGGLLQHQLLNLLQPKPDPQVARAKVIGNIWENWPKTQAESTPPAEEN